MSPADRRKFHATFFATTPEWVLYAPITHGARLAYGYLDRIANSAHRGEDAWWPSPEELGALMGKSPRAIRGYYKELRSIGAIGEGRRQRYGPTLWHLRRDPPPEIQDGKILPSSNGQDGSSLPPSPPGRRNPAILDSDTSSCSLEEVREERGAGGPPHAHPRKGRLPRNYALSDGLRAWTTETSPTLDIDLEFGSFCEYYWSRGTQMEEWDSAWKRWVYKAMTYEIANGPESRPRRSAGDVAEQMAALWLEEGDTGGE